MTELELSKETNLKWFRNFPPGGIPKPTPSSPIPSRIVPEIDRFIRIKGLLVRSVYT